jgi:hypothetical protein
MEKIVVYESAVFTDGKCCVNCGSGDLKPFVWREKAAYRCRMCSNEMLDEKERMEMKE